MARAQGNVSRESDRLQQEVAQSSTALKEQTTSLAAAKKEIEALLALKSSSPIIADLAAEVAAANGDLASAQRILREALLRFPQASSLVYGYADSLYASRQYEDALKFLDSQVQLTSADFKLYGLQAKNYAALGKRVQQLRSQAEFYYRQGQLGQAIEQLQFAQQQTDGSFYEQSAVDARLRELRKQQSEEDKQKRDGG